VNTAKQDGGFSSGRARTAAAYGILGGQDWLGIIFGDLIGKLDVPRIECANGRAGR
jgi:hypothetical protein